MKKVLLILIGCLVLATVPATALIVNIKTPSGSGSGSIYPGGTISLETWMTIDSGEAVGALGYTVELPVEGWTLLNRDYTTYGWSNDVAGLVDWSEPPEGSTPAVVNNDLYEDASSPADFSFETQRADNGEISGPTTVTVETFQLQIPAGATLDTYTLWLRPFFAGGAQAEPVLTTPGETSFELTIAIPEPTSLVLLGGGLAALSLRRRRGKASQI